MSEEIIDAIKYFENIPEISALSIQPKYSGVECQITLDMCNIDKSSYYADIVNDLNDFFNINDLNNSMNKIYHHLYINIHKLCNLLLINVEDLLMIIFDGVLLNGDNHSCMQWIPYTITNIITIHGQEKTISVFQPILQFDLCQDLISGLYTDKNETEHLILFSDELFEQKILKINIFLQKMIQNNINSIIIKPQLHDPNSNVILSTVCINYNTITNTVTINKNFII
jgi:hypothetical protein